MQTQTMTVIATPRRVSARSVTAVMQRRRSRAVRVTLASGLLLVLWMWWASVPATFTSTPASVATTVGELSGMVGAYLVCAQVLLIARVPWFERAVGLDRLVSWHRSLGASVVFLVITHVMFIVIGGQLLDQNLPWTEFMLVLTRYPDMLAALIGTLAFLAVGLSSARWIRSKLPYEFWYWLHLTTYVAIFLTFFHQLSGGAHFVADPLNRILWIVLYLGTAAAVLTWRFVLPSIDGWRRRMRVVAVVQESPGMTSVWFSGKHVDELGVRAGNFLNFRFLTWGHLLTAHPYSVSRVPVDGQLRITVGALGDHSTMLRDLKPGTLVFAEGPFGHFTADHATRDRILLIAGGAGIGPIRALAEELTARGRQPVVLYRAHSVEHLALLAELQAMPELTVVPVIGRRSELGYDPLETVSMRNFIPDLHTWEAFICGPEGMAIRAEETLRALGMPRRFIHREELSLS